MPQIRLFQIASATDTLVYICNITRTRPERGCGVTYAASCFSWSLRQLRLFLFEKDTRVSIDNATDTLVSVCECDRNASFQLIV